jgi:hypothetical protein
MHSWMDLIPILVKSPLGTLGYRDRRRGLGSFSSFEISRPIVRSDEVLLRITLKILAIIVSLLGSAKTMNAQSLGAERVMPNLESNIDRPLRYRPDRGDFLIKNGTEFFNRSLYGGNTAFRVDGGDKPEFVL